MYLVKLIADQIKDQSGFKCCRIPAVADSLFRRRRARSFIHSLCPFCVDESNISYDREQQYQNLSLLRSHRKNRREKSQCFHVKSLAFPIEILYNSMHKDIFSHRAKNILEKHHHNDVQALSHPTSTFEELKKFVQQFEIKHVNRVTLQRHKRSSYA